MTILPHNTYVPSHRQHSIQGLTTQDIEDRIGFPPNSQGDRDKTISEWVFTVDGEICSVWDYKGRASRNEFSAFGPLDALRKVFGDYCHPGPL